MIIRKHIYLTVTDKPPEPGDYFIVKSEAEHTPFIHLCTIKSNRFIITDSKMFKVDEVAKVTLDLNSR